MAGFEKFGVFLLDILISNCAFTIKRHAKYCAVLRLIKYFSRGLILKVWRAQKSWRKNALIWALEGLGEGFNGKKNCMLRIRNCGQAKSGNKLSSKYFFSLHCACAGLILLANKT